MASRKTSKSNFVLVIEIHSSAVNASVVDMSHSGSTFNPSEVLCSSGLNFSGQQNIVASLKKALRKVIETTTREFELYRQLSSTGSTKSGTQLSIGMISSVEFVLSSPWILSQAHTISTKLSKKEKITEALINKILDKKDLKPSFHVKDINCNLHTVERKVMEVSLNGYPMSDWQDKIASSVDITCIVSAVDRNIVNDLQQSCEHVVPVKQINFHSSLILQFIASTNYSASSADVVVINVHGKVTDLFGTSKQNGMFFGSFPVGYETLTRRLANATHQGRQISESALSMHSNLHIDFSHGRTTIKIIEKVLANWRHECAEFMKITTSSSSQTHIFLASRHFSQLFIRSVKSIRSLTKCDVLPVSSINEALFLLIK